MPMLELLTRLVQAAGPPGQEDEVRNTLAAELANFDFKIDEKGNLLVGLGSSSPRVVVTAHLDEIAMMVQRILPDGSLSVVRLGGAYPWKWGEGPVEILTTGGRLPGILSFGSIHTTDPAAVAQQARVAPLEFAHARIFTGYSPGELKQSGVRPGCRVVLGRSRRVISEIGPYIGSYFLDDRADLVAWVLALRELRDSGIDVLFAATTSEEVGGEGAQYLLQKVHPPICVALELAPVVPDAPIMLDERPVVWARDSYASMESVDGAILEAFGDTIQWQVLSSGGSDASCAASRGLCARPVTLGIPMLNSHGYEVMHRDAPEALSEALLAYLGKVFA